MKHFPYPSVRFNLLALCAIGFALALSNTSVAQDPPPTAEPESPVEATAPVTPEAPADTAEPKPAEDAVDAMEKRDPFVEPPATAEEPATPATTEETTPATLPVDEPEEKPDTPAEEKPTTLPKADDPRLVQQPANLEDVRLKFNFQFAPWKDVLDWFAKQADLSLVLDDPPAGTFNYKDDRTYTPAQAIDLLNSVLLSKGYTLVRRGRMLMMFNLEDGPIPPNLVQSVTPEELDSRGEFELISCLFRIDKMTPEEADSEIRKLLGPQGTMVVLNKAKQILVTETAGKLRTIRKVIETVENPDGQDKHVVTIPLKNLMAEEALPMIRHMLGMPEEQFAMPDGSLRFTLSPDGSQFYVTGRREAVTRMEDVVKLIDHPPTPGEGDLVVDEPQLEVHNVGTADPALVLQVCQTLLAGIADVRLAVDAQTNQLVALARPDQHGAIKATIAQMQGSNNQQCIEVIRLNVVDPSSAAVYITSVFSTGEEDATTLEDGLRVEADTIGAQLVVRGTQSQIEQIKQLLEKLGETKEAAAEAEAARSGSVRILDLSEREADTVIGQIQEIWPTMRKNRIRVLSPSSKSKEPEEPESGSRFDRTKSNKDNPLFPPELLRELMNSPPAPAPLPAKPEESDAPPKDEPAPPSEEPLKTAARGQSSFFRTAVLKRPASESSPGANRITLVQTQTPDTPATRPADIIVSQSPSGLMLVSSDLDALDALERLINRLVGPETLLADREYAVYYLKFAKADVAGALLKEILTGGSGDSGGGGGMGGLMGGLAGAALGGGGGDLMGSLMGLAGGGGGGFTTQGEVSIISDTRLNALVIQAVPDDLDMIEELLEIIDKEKSPESVQVVAKPRMIPIKYMQAQEVATIVQQVFAAQMSKGASTAQRGPSPEDFLRALRGGGGGSSKPKQDEPKISIGVDIRSNSLVVSAPDSLFEQVKDLVEQLDSVDANASQTTQVLSLRRASPAVIQQALSSMIEGDIQTRGGSTRRTTTSNRGRTTGGSTRGGTSSNRGSSAANAARMMQGMQMLRAMQGGGAPGGGRPTSGGRPSGGRGGSSGRGR